LRPIGGTHEITVHWITGGREEVLTEDEVEAYPAGARCGYNASQGEKLAPDAR
jgi:hypothetical protein